MTDIKDESLVDVTIAVAAMHIRDVVRCNLKPRKDRLSFTVSTLNDIIADATKLKKFFMQEEMELKKKLEQASINLRKYFGREHPPWLTAIGIADRKLIVYTAKKKHPEIPTEWQGFPVETRFIGKLRLS